LSAGKIDRELTVEESIGWTFRLYFNNFVTLFTPMFVASLVAGGLGALFAYYIRDIPPLSTGASVQEILNWGAAYIPRLALAGFAAGLLAWIISAIAAGVTVKCASELIDTGTTSLGKAFSFTLSKVITLLAAAIIVGIIVLAGIIALIIPGIILAIMLSLSVAVIMIENTGSIDSLSRSRKLVSGRWLKTFVFFLVIGIILGIMSWIGSLIGAPLGVYGWIITGVVSAFIAPIVPSAMTVYYYSMRAKEQKQTAH
jgi:hypothetical protein